MPDRPSPIRRTLRFLWRWSLMVTVPVGVLFVLWCVRTVDRYRDLGVEFQTLNDQINLDRVGSLEARSILRDIELAVRPRRTRTGPGLRALQLYVPEGSEQALLKELPHSGRTYVEAALQYPDGDIHEVKVKFRGDHFWHFAGRKQSLRIKTKKKHLHERTRALNLNAPKQPDQISGHLSLVLARQLGLITPRGELVELYVNGMYRGLHLMFEQMEEMTLRTNGKMPGDFFAGDLVKRDRYRGLTNKLFENAGVWDKIAINNHFEIEEAAALEELVALTAEPPSPERSAALRDLVDMEAFGAFAAFRVLCQSFHYDDTHNWRLYYDPWRNHFVPVVWDPVGWHVGWVPQANMSATLDILTSRIDRVLLEDHAFIHARQVALDRYFSSGKDEELIEELEDALLRSHDSIDRDPGLAFRAEMMDVAEVREAQQDLRANVLSILRDTEDAFRVPAQVRYAVTPGAPGSLIMRVDGRRSLIGVDLNLMSPPDGRLDVSISWLTPDGPQRVDVSGALSVQGTRVRIDVPLMGQLLLNENLEVPVRLRHEVESGPGVYGLTLAGPGFQGNSVVSLVGLHGNGEGRAEERVSATRVQRIRPVPILQAQAVVDPRPRRTPVAWTGERVFEGVSTVTDDVIIEAGTVLRMAPGATVIFEGRVVARGTKASPIRVEPLEPGQDPWGVIAVRGDGADGSNFAWMEMREGSGYKVPLSEYSAMFSVHDVDNITIEDCTFKDSKIVDDMLHAVYSSVRISRCTFIRSLADAVDLDISRGLVEDCHFIESGNDGLDLMTSTIILRGTRIERSGDKGVSVGEDTEVFVLDSVIEGCLIGMQIKDRSRAIVVGTDILDNDQGVDAYKKNWRYDSGGFGFLYKSILRGNTSSLSADKHSLIRTRDCAIETEPKEDKDVVLDALTDIGTRRAARSPRLERFEEEVARDVPFFRPYWPEIDPRRRGAKPSN